MSLLSSLSRFLLVSPFMMLSTPHSFRPLLVPSRALEPRLTPHFLSQPQPDKRKETIKVRQGEKKKKNHDEKDQPLFLSRPGGSRVALQCSRPMFFERRMPSHSMRPGLLSGSFVTRRNVRPQRQQGLLRRQLGLHPRKVFSSVSCDWTVRRCE